MHNIGFVDCFPVANYNKTYKIVWENKVMVLKPLPYLSYFPKDEAISWWRGKGDRIVNSFPDDTDHGEY